MQDEAGNTPESEEPVTSQPISLGPPAGVERKEEQEDLDGEGGPDERTNLHSGAAQPTYGAEVSAGASGDSGAGQ